MLTLGTGRARALRRVAERTKDISFRSLHDGLTGLPNRALLLSRIEQALSRARLADTDVAVMFLDLDGFKAINDMYGHASGDLFLQAVSSRVADVVRDTDTLGRLGGDEFVVVLEGASLEEGPEVVAGRVLDAITRPLDLSGAPEPVCPSASIGIATGLRDTADELLRDADLAMYQAKTAGKNRFVRFTPARPVPVRCPAARSGTTAEPATTG